MRKNPHLISILVFFFLFRHETAFFIGAYEFYGVLALFEHIGAAFGTFLLGGLIP